jgi:hypothetical protein
MFLQLLSLKKYIFTPMDYKYNFISPAWAIL